ncbi:ATP-binding cassette domain-containing protein [Polaribacter sp. IC073]|uniref:ATP-binding cassette domain-containing protein n=1 Tax=Polaribacter sp. IC073 TaxID=2508540 RepID=UPI0011BF2386|nr:ATP-binding cassette domain-containing protein [Polaribacter sp. IC073]TXD49068.1 ATP-binding cassette domain-containing protein [Polaribacter sp. IC073]
MENFHFAIKNKSLSTKSIFLENILNDRHNLSHLKNKKGLLFSNSVLEKFIEKEARHQTLTLTIKENRGIRTFSSGEQKKALLAYLIQQKPHFLILDSPFESLDSNAISNLEKTLLTLASEIVLIQLFNREEEITSIITHVLEVEKDVIISTTPIEKYNFTENNVVFKGEVPKAINCYDNIPKQLVSFKNVSVNYDENCVLKNINWTINKNEFWQLIGPNGSGKTTILSMIYGNNIKAYGQEVYLFGKKKGSGESVWDIKQKIGYFSPVLLELFERKVTILEMMLSGFFDSIGLYNTPTTLQVKIAEDWMLLLGLDNNKNSFFQNVSTTKQRLILIARAMIKHPPLLILDEPLINLDNQGTEIVVTLINKIALESDTTVLFVSHRSVKNLQPNYTYELMPSKKGSLGRVKK